MKWRATTDPDLIECPPFFIRRARSGERFVLGKDLGKQTALCVGGFDTAAEAKAEAERLNDRERAVA